MKLNQKTLKSLFNCNPAPESLKELTVSKMKDQKIIAALFEHVVLRV